MSFQAIVKLAVASILVVAGGDINATASQMPNKKDTIEIEKKDSDVSVSSISRKISASPKVESELETDFYDVISLNNNPSSLSPTNINNNLVDASVDNQPLAEAPSDSKKLPLFDPQIKFQLYAVDVTSYNNYWGSSESQSFNDKYSKVYNQFIIVPVASVSFLSSRKDELRIMGVLSNFKFDSPGCGTPNLAIAYFYCFPTDQKPELYRAWYSYKINDNIKIMGGPRLYSYDLLPVSTASYSPKGTNYIGLKSLLYDINDYATVPGTYPLTLGPGGGISFSKNGWALGGGVIAGNQQSDSNALANNVATTGVVQLSYTGRRAGFQAAYTNSSYYNGQVYFQQGSLATLQPFNFATSMDVQTASIGGYYYIIPDRFSISGGTNFSFYEADSGNVNAGVVKGDTARGRTWLVTLQYDRAFRDDITIGTSFGQQGMLTSNTSQGAIDDQSSNPYIVTAFLNWQISKNVSLAPHIYWSRSVSTTSGGQTSPSTSSFGAALMATLALY